MRSKLPELLKQTATLSKVAMAVRGGRYCWRGLLRIIYHGRYPALSARSEKSNRPPQDLKNENHYNSSTSPPNGGGYGNNGGDGWRLGFPR